MSLSMLWGCNDKLVEYSFNARAQKDSITAVLTEGHSRHFDLSF